MRGRITWMFLLFVGLAASRAAAQDAPVLKPAASVRFADGYIAGCFALSPDGRQLAYITVKQNGETTLVLRDLASGAEKSAVITKFTDEPEAVFFLPENAGVVVAAKTDKTHFAVFDAEAKEITQIKGQDVLTWRGAGKDFQLVAYRQDKASTSVTHTVTLFEPQNLRKAAKTYLVRTDAANRFSVKNENVELIYFNSDFSKAFVKVIGGYNKATDSKFPDNQGIYEVETGTLQKGAVISNNAAFDRDAAWFARNGKSRTPVRLSGVPTIQGIDGSFQVGQGILQWKDIAPRFQLGRFDFATFLQAPVQYDAKTAFFAMAIHPQNPITLQYKKSEKRAWHFFRLDAETGNAEDLGQVQAEESVISWSLAGKSVASMRLSPNWQVGSEILEIYQIP